MAKDNKKLVLQLEDQPEFPATNDGALITSYKLSKYINTLFSQIFVDYSGCIVYTDQSNQNGIAMLNNNHPVQLELYFVTEYSKPENDNRIQAFEHIRDSVKHQFNTGEGRTNFLEKAIGHNATITQNKTYMITKDAIDIIAPLLWNEYMYKLSNNPQATEFAKRGITVESTIPKQSGNFYNPAPQTIVYNIIRFTDVNSILQILFSKKDDEFVYNVVPVKPLSQIGYQFPNQDRKWLFMIYRINQKNLYDMCNEIGQFNSTNGLNIYTDSYRTPQM